MPAKVDSDPRQADKIFWSPDSERRLGRARDWLFVVAERIRTPWFWRCLYWFLGRRTLARILAEVLTVWDSRSPGRAENILARTSEVTSGWPRRSFGAANLDVRRLLDRVDHHLQASRWPVVTRRAVGGRTGRLRIGLVGQFSSLLTLSSEHIRALAGVADVNTFDLDFRGRHASYLANCGGEYRAFTAWRAPSPGTLDPPSELRAVAEAINQAALDLLLVASGRFALALLGLIETPCVAYLATGSSPLFHDRVDFQPFVQPTADYFIRRGQLFCATSRAPMHEPGIFHGHLLYDRRNLSGVSPLPWSRRAPLIVFHGSLYKAASQPYLDCIFDLLRNDPELQFVLVGKDDGRSWAFIHAAAVRASLSHRVQWDGAYARFRGADGVSIADEGWLRLIDLLQSARLAPDPWPIGGGSSRVEAYLLGVPAPHMALRTDSGSWGHQQHTILEPDALHVHSAAAATVTDYRNLCRRILSDASAATAVVAEQLTVASRVTDPALFWQQILSLYGEWVRLNS